MGPDPGGDATRSKPAANDLNGFVFFLAHLMWGASLALIVRAVNK